MNLASTSEAEMVTIFNAGRDDIDRKPVSDFRYCGDCYPAQSLSERKEGMHRPVTAFRIETETHLVFERFNYGVYGFIILEYILKPVSLTDHRNYSQEEHYLGNEGFLEHIRPSPEYGLILESL